MIRTYKPDAIRDDFARFLNDIYMEKVQKRAPRMVWRDGTDLHVTNLSGLFVVDPQDFISKWRRGIEIAKHQAGRNEADRCLWGTVFSLFDSVHIHSMKTDALGVRWTDSVTVIPTDRKEIFAKAGMGKPL